jgi:hypothetical protein
MTEAIKIPFYPPFLKGWTNGDLSQPSNLHAGFLEAI